MSYWCGEQLVVTVTGPAGRRVISLAQPFARVGSHPSSEVLLEGASIATRCLYLHATERGVFCLFLDVNASAAANSTERGRWLAPDEDLVIGPYRVRASLLTAEAGDEVPTDGLAVWGSAPRPLPVLMVYCGDLLKDKRRFRARLSPIGRRPQCALQLKGQVVSGFHCVLFWEQQQLWCIDLNSSNGTELNGKPISCSPVNIGDRLEVGEFGLVFQRLSYGKSAAGRPTSSPVKEMAEFASAAATSDDASEVGEPMQPAAVLPVATAIVTTPAPAAVAQVPPLATVTQQAIDAALAQATEAARAAETLREAEHRRLRDQLTDEVARLSRERQELHSQWEQTSQQLISQIAQLHAEAAKLADERQALQQSRQEWQSERAALTAELTQRSEHLTRLESDLAAATDLVAKKLKAAAVPAVMPVPTFQAGPSPEELARQEEQRRLHEQLSAEMDRLARERQALDQSRQEWQAEREALATEFTRRSQHLERLETELTSATGLLAQKLEAATLPPPAEPLPAVPLLPTGPSLEELARREEQRRLHEQWATEMARMTRERQELQSQWEQASQKLVGQIGNLEQQTQRLTEEREALAHTRHEWQDDRSRLTGQLEQRTEQLNRLEAELAAVAASFASKLAVLEHPVATTPVNGVDATGVAVSTIPPAVEATPTHLPQPLVAQVGEECNSCEPASEASDDREQSERSLSSDEDSSDDLVLDEPPTDESFEPVAAAAMEAVSPAAAQLPDSLSPVSPSPALLPPPPLPPESGFSPPQGAPVEGKAPQIGRAKSLADRDQLPHFVSDRLVELDQAAWRKKLLWWSAGGVGLVAFIALAVTVWLWLF